MTEEWLSLNRAAARLGVHPTTLRRWADDGELPVMRTPGGHRRFSATDLDRFARQHRTLSGSAGVEQVWAEQAITITRREINQKRDAQWMRAFDDEDRERKRQLGQRLIGVMLQYISVDEASEALLDEARAIGRLHAEKGLSLGMPLTSALQAMMFFRDALIDSALELPASARVPQPANTRLVRRINRLLSTVELSIAEVYDEARA